MNRRAHRPATCIVDLVRDRRGVSAIEFALVLPVLLFIVMGGYEICQAVSAYHKTTLTARTVADLTTQYSTMSQSDVSTVLNASAQVMAPFNSASLSIILTEYRMSAIGIATVTWSKALNGTAPTQGSLAILPANICLPNASIVLSQVTYTFTPNILFQSFGPFKMKSSMFMSPRATQSITYSDS